MNIGSANSSEQKLHDPDWIAEVNKKIVYKPESTNNIVIKPNNIYSETDKINKQFNLYIPTNKKNKKLPVVIFVHGGPIPRTLKTKPKDWGFFTSYGNAIAQSGYVAITFNLSLYDFESYSSAHNDLNELITYIRKNSYDLAIDKNNIVLWFFSGAGPLMAPYIENTPKYLKAMIAFYPILDLQPFKKQISVTSQQILVDYSPILKLSKDSTVPIFIARAGLDRNEINEAIDKFADKANSIGLNINLINNTMGRHGFDKDVGESEDDTKKIIGSAIEFIANN